MQAIRASINLCPQSTPKHRFAYGLVGVIHCGGCHPHQVCEVTPVNRAGSGSSTRPTVLGPWWYTWRVFWYYAPDVLMRHTLGQGSSRFIVQLESTED